MTLPEIATRDEWLKARKKLWKQEKDLTHRRDRISADRRRLPMVKIEKEYVFEDSNGTATLLDLFEGRSQLIVGHFMFDPRGRSVAPAARRAPTRCPKGTSCTCMLVTRRSRTSRAPDREDRGLQALEGVDLPLVFVVWH